MANPKGLANNSSTLYKTQTTHKSKHVQFSRNALIILRLSLPILRKKLANRPKIPPNDASALGEFSDFLYQVQIASQHMSGPGVLGYPSQIQSFVERLPGWFKNKWSDKVLKLQKRNGKDDFPSFKDFVQEVRYHAERTNILQIALTSGTSSSTQSDHSRNFNRTPLKRSANSAFTSTPATERDGEVIPQVELNQTSNVLVT